MSSMRFPSRINCPYRIGSQLRWLLMTAGLAAGCILVRPLSQCEILSHPPTRITTWVEDPHQNVLPQDNPSANSASMIEVVAIRNEFECAQVVLRSGVRVDGMTVRISDLHTNEELRISCENFEWHVVGYVPVRRNTPNTPLSQLVARAPGRFPDPLLEKESFSLAPGRNQPIWLTFWIPPDTHPGEYRGRVEFSVTERESDSNANDSTSGECITTVPVTLRVLNATLPSERHFGFSTWFSHMDLAKQHGVRLWSEEFWRLLRAYAQNLAEHRQTTILTPMELIRATRKPNGCLAFDFEQFDRWANVFFQAGFTTIEGKPLGHRVGKWTSPIMRFAPFPVHDTLRRRRRPLPNEVVLRAFLKTLEKHLERRGWLNRFVMHVADEPTRYNVESWRQMSRFIHRAAPRLRRIEANQIARLDGDIEISVPQLDTFHQAMNQYLEQRRKFGYELWFYTCMFPTGSYANRFIDYPLMKTRLLPWIAARYGLTGYLHWGGNYWSSQPFVNVERSNLPPGDSFIFYPGKDKPVNSIRWEMLREGIEDYECLRLLGKDSMRRFAAMLIKTPSQYDVSPKRLREVCRKAREIAGEVR